MYKSTKSMKNLKLLYSLLVVLGAGLFASCTNDNTFTPGEVPDGPQVYWNTTNSTSIEFTGAVEEANQTLTLSRVVTDEELTIAVIADIAEGAEFFQLPETVTFKQGEATATLHYVVNFEKFENDKKYSILFKIMNNVATPYGCSEWSVSYSLNPWELMTDAAGNAAKGKFRGLGFIDALDVDTSIEVDVDIYKHKSTEGMYKIANPWQMSLAILLGYESLEEAEADGLVALNDLIIDATDPSAVVVAEQEIGIDIGMGPMFVFTGYPNYLEAAVGAGVLANGIITFPTKGTFAYFPEYDAESIFYGNNSGMIRIVLPGVEIADYSIGVVYEGMDVSADSKTIFAKLQFSYSDDVTGIKYIVVPGNIESNPVEALQALIDGTAENITEVAGFVKGSGVANVKYGLTEQGDYTVVAAPADKNGALSAKDAVAVSFFFQGLGAVEEHPCEISVDVDKMSVYMPQYSSAYPDSIAAAFMVVGKDIKEAMYLMAPTATIEAMLAEGVTLGQLITEHGYAFEAADIEEVNGEGYINGFPGLNPATSYTMAVWAKNKYGEETIAVDTHTTDAVEEIEYTGELKIGDYYMACTMGAGTDSETTFENLFTVTPDGESVTDFIVANIGANVNGIEPQWMAKYDSAASTLTLDGVEKGYEEYGNCFGQIYAWADQAQTIALVFFSFATMDSNGADPLVLNVDPETKAVCGMQNAAFIAALVDAASGQPLQYWGYYDGSLTTITPYTAAATASVKSVPFSSVNLNRVHCKGIKSVKMANLAGTSKKSGVKTVAPTFVENYTPEKVSFKSVKTSAKAICR